MKEKSKVNSVLGVALGGVAAAPTWTTAAVLSLLGLAGGTAAMVATWLTWLSPLLIGVSVLLLGRALYVLHVLKRGSRTSLVLTWAATLLVIGFWTWHFIRS